MRQTDEVGYPHCSSMAFMAYPLGLWFSLVSGFAALLLEVAWQRMLTGLYGSDGRSVSILTATFLSGMGCGALLAGCMADRIGSRSATRTLVGIQCCVAVFACLSGRLFLEALASDRAAEGETDERLARIGLACLWGATVGMGGGLPLLARATVQETEDAAVRISRLYAVGILGAVGGALSAAFVLVGTVGCVRTIDIGAGLSLVSAAFLWFAGTDSREDDRLTARKRIGETRSFHESVLVSCWPALFFLVGFQSLTFQIVWFRVLHVVNQSTVYTFAYFLALVLAGNAAGVLFTAGRMERVRIALGHYLCAAAGAVTVGVLALHLMPFVFSGSGWGLTGEARAEWPPWSVAGVTHALVVQVVLPPVVVFFPSLLFGVTFSLGQKLVQKDLSRLGRRLGVAQLAGILGNIAGSLCTGLLIVPRVGTPTSVRLLGVSGLAWGIAAVIHSARFRLRSSLALSSGLSLALGLMCVGGKDAEAFWSRLHGVQSGERAYVAEDQNGVVVLRGTPQGYFVLFVGGQDQGKIPYVIEHLFLGAVPSIIHPRPTRVLSVGLGSSGTPFALGVRRETEHIHVVEIVGAEYTVLKRFARDIPDGRLRRFLADPRCHIEQGDGRRFLQTTQERFDIIEADALPPGVSGSGFLYSREFFQLARSRLTESGIMAQWLATPRVYATFASVFPHTVNVGDFLLLGSNVPIPYERGSLLRALGETGVRDYLGLDDVALARMRRSWVERPAWVCTRRSEVSPSWINTDQLPRDEFFLNQPIIPRCENPPDLHGTR